MIKGTDVYKGDDRESNAVLTASKEQLTPDRTNRQLARRPAQVAVGQARCHLSPSSIMTGRFNPTVTDKLAQKSGLSSATKLGNRELACFSIYRGKSALSFATIHCRQLPLNRDWSRAVQIVPKGIGTVSLHFPC
jgi:hypothetical protein